MPLLMTVKGALQPASETGLRRRTDAPNTRSYCLMPWTMKTEPSAGWRQSSTHGFGVS
jgi:hypothetical protein